MNVYAIVMLAVSVLFGVISFQIYRGKTELIHDYHQTKVQDKAAYGKTFGKALSVFAAAMLLSGIVSLMGEDAVPSALVILFCGIGIGTGCILAVQKKYNNGLF